MRISTLRICISTIIPFLSIASTYADTEIIPSPDPQCNQYFDAGYVYEGDNGKELFDVVRNIGSNELDLYQDEQISPIIDTS